MFLVVGTNKNLYKFANSIVVQNTVKFLCIIVFFFFSYYFFFLGGEITSCILYNIEGEIIGFILGTC